MTIYPEGFGVFLESHSEPIARCLESVVYGQVEDRRAILAAVGRDAEALARLNDAKRSSLSDFSAYSHQLAKRFREKLSEPS